MRVSVSIANVTADDLAHAFQGREYWHGDVMSGSVVANVGFGRWGVELGATATFDDITPEEKRDILHATKEIIVARKESAAWISEDEGEYGYLLLDDGGNTDPKQPAEPAAAFESQA